MKRNMLILILAAVAAICVLLHILEASSPMIFSTAMAFPFEQIGLALRTLSLSGKAGNLFAIAIYAAICLMPAALLLLQAKRRKLYFEDSLLLLLSILLFAVLYLMINPGFISEFTKGEAGMPVGMALLGGTVYSVLFGYIVLRILRLFFIANNEKLIGYLSAILGLLSVLFVCVIFGVYAGNFLDSIETLQRGNAGSEHLLGMSYFFLGLQFMVDALPYAMNLVIVFSGLRLLHEMLIDRYSAESVVESEKLSRCCRAALSATVLSNISFNILQLMFAKSLMVINGSLQIPVFSIAFVLSALLLTRFVAENKELRDDNDLFI